MSTIAQKVGLLQKMLNDLQALKDSHIELENEITVLADDINQSGGGFVIQVPEKEFTFTGGKIIDFEVPEGLEVVSEKNEIPANLVQLFGDASKKLYAYCLSMDKTDDAFNDIDEDDLPVMIEVIDIDIGDPDAPYRLDERGWPELNDKTTIVLLSKDNE